MKKNPVRKWRDDEFNVGFSRSVIRDSVFDGSMGSEVGEK